MKAKRGHLYVQVEPTAKVGSVSALKAMEDPTVTGPCALRTVD